MYKNKVLAMLGVVGSLLAFNCYVNAAESTLLNSQKFKVINENYIDCVNRDAKILFNNQNLLPKTPVQMNTQNLDLTTWQPNYKVEFGKPSCIIDLGAYYVITDISYYDTYSSPTGQVFQGSPSNWESIGNLNLGGYKSYKILHNNNQKGVRYLRINSSDIQSGIAEIGIYGYKVSELTTKDISMTGPKKVTSSPDNLTSGKKIGTNAFVDDPYTTLAAVGNIREYYSLNWVVTENNKYKFNSVVNHDDYYKTLKEMKISVIPCIQYTVPSLVDKNADFDKARNYKPIAPGANASDPMSYSLHSNFMYNFAARYGSNKNIDKSTLNVDNGTEVLVGLDYLNSVEAWNEPNKTWEGVNGYFTPEEFAAMLSSDWDGHEGKIKNGGVKTADKNFKLIMGGLWWQGSDDNVINYLDRMKIWFDYNRKDGVFCSDVINVHIGVGKNPEKADWDSKIALLQKWIDENVPGTELWISEFDVDATEYEKSGVDNHNNTEYALARAQKLLRSYLIADKQGVDRLSMFMIRDTSYGVYYNSGLTTGKGEWDKKTSWYFVSSAQDTLKNADLINVSESNDVYIYTYKDRKTSEVIYAVWSPTSSGKQIKNYQINVGNYQKATMVVPTDGVMEGEKTGLSITNGKVNIDVTETVKFIKVSNTDVAYDNFPQKLITIQQLRLGALNGSRETFTFSNNEIVNLLTNSKPLESNFMLTQFYHLFDEQNATNTPQTPWRIIKKENKPKTEMGALSVHKDRAYPYDAIITFDDFYDITYIGLYDTYSVGLMEIYDDNTGKLIYKTNLDSYDYWRLVPMTSNVVSTNRIRIVKYNDAKINELSFYGYKSNSKVGKPAEAKKGIIGLPSISKYLKLGINNVTLGPISLTYKNQNANIQKSFNYLFDEQSKTPSNADESVAMNTKWSTAFTNIWGNGLKFPYDCIINLNERKNVTQIGLWLGWGRNDGKIELYNAENNKLIISKTVTGSNKWVVLDLPTSVNTQKLKLVKYDDKPIYEVSFFGNDQK